jgi:hypothetical protein
LLHLDYFAPARHYFERFLPVFERVRESLQLKAVSPGGQQ